MRTSLHPIMEKEEQTHEPHRRKKRYPQRISNLTNNVQESTGTFNVSESYSLHGK